MLLGEVSLEEINLHIQDGFVAERCLSLGEKLKKKKKLGAHLSVNEVNSSCIMLEVVSLDLMSFNASSWTGLIPSC